MSERSSFTSEYIYDPVTYRTVRARLEENGSGKYLCVAPAPSYDMSGHHFELPIISGKIGTLAMNSEWIDLEEILRGLVTDSPVRFVIVCDGGEIHLVTKQADGDVFTKFLAPVDY